MRQMKDSGIEWIGKIPETWGSCKVSRLYNVQLGKMLQPNQITDTDTYESYLCAANVGQNALKFFPLRQMWIQKKERDIYSLSKGDLIVVEGGDVASCDIIKDNVNNLFFQNALHRVRAKKGYTVDYLRYVLMTAKAVGYIDLICNKATISHFTKEKFENLVIPISHISEQQRIVDYLDEKCGEIDSLIGLQEQMIEKLKAYKQSVITEAVTKGLDPNAKLVPSSIDWIGEIPEGWKVTPLKWILRMPLQYGANESGRLYDDSLPRYVRITDILNNNLREDLQKQSLTEEQANGYILEDNDILFARSGGTVGKAFIYKSKYGRCAFAGYLIRAQINSRNDSKFIYYYTQSSSYDEWKKQIFIQATIQNIGADRYSTLEIPIPPLSEQRSIASYLDSKCADIERLIALKQQKIESLKDYKKSVIYEAVTGKTIIE